LLAYHCIIRLSKKKASDSFFIFQAGAMRLSKLTSIPLPILVFLFVRIAVILSSTLEGLRGYGDFLHFFNLASNPGLPFIRYWSEFPPLFPFLSKGLYGLSGGQEHVYTYLLVLILLLADLGNLYLALRLLRRLVPASNDWRGLLYAALLAGLAYTWWYFDSIAMFFTLLVFELAFSKRHPALAGAALGLGILTKLFPALILPALWLAQPRRRSAWITSTALGLTLLVYGALWVQSPEFTLASLRSQSAKGSWSTVWAIIDGNYNTGNFGPEIERLDPAAATVPRGNPARINSWLTLVLFGSAGLAIFLRTRLTDVRAVLCFTGLTWVIFFLWSPGWSPQWVVYLIPLMLLTLPEHTAPLLTGLFVLVNLLEWPLLLSRGLFSSLPLTILLRTALLILLGLMWWQELNPKKMQV
jgi:hypothetical protein